MTVVPDSALPPGSRAQQRLRRIPATAPPPRRDEQGQRISPGPGP